MELEKILNSKGFQEENNVGEVCSLDLRHRGHQHLILVLVESVETISDSVWSILDQLCPSKAPNLITRHE